MTTLEKAIERFEKNAEFERRNYNLQGCLDFRQLAEWLKDYKRLLEQEPCTDVVSREWLKKKLQEHHDFFVNAYGRFKNMPQTDKARVDEITNCIAEVVNAPSVNPQEQIGHWILQSSNKEQSERDFIWWKCSECGQVIYSETEKDRREYHAFCGRCGAKMVEPQESEDKQDEDKI